MKKRNFFLIGLFALILIFLTTGCSEQTEEVITDSTISVNVAEVKSGVLSAEREFMGSTEAKIDLTLIPKGAGVLKSLHVSNGDSVNEGQLLAKLDDTDAKYILQQSQTALKRAESGLNLAREVHHQSLSGLKQAEATLNQAREKRSNDIETSHLRIEKTIIQWEEAKKQLERFEGLFAENIISEKDYELAINAEKLAEIGHKEATLAAQFFGNEDQIKILESAVDLAQVGINQAEVRINEAETAVEEVKISVEQAEQRVEDTQIKAPTAGEVASISKDIGEFVSNQAPFIRLVMLDEIVVEAKVTSEQLALFKIGEKLTVSFISLLDSYEGEIDFISKTTDQSGLYTIEVVIINTEQLIKPGMIATLFTEHIHVAEGLLVPTEAVFERNSQAYVFVIKANQADLTEVEVVRTESELTALKGEIVEADLVVTKGQNLLLDGDKVNVVKGDSDHELD